jgi:hypothetical protein
VLVAVVAAIRIYAWRAWRGCAARAVAACGAQRVRVLLAARYAAVRVASA